MVGCKAILKPKKRFDDDRISVNLTQQTNHNRDSSYTLSKQGFSPRVKSWLEKIVASRNNWTTCKALIRLDEATLDILESDDLLQIDTPVQIPEVCRVRPQDFYNTRLAYLEGRVKLDSNCSESLMKYVELIRFEGRISTLEERNMGRSASDFYFAFSTPWQIKFLQKYPSLLCLSSTYNTCVALDNSRMAFLYTIVVRHTTAGFGVPVAFMVMSSETRVLLELCLRWLKVNVSMTESLTFMIDCSLTEIAGIKAAFISPNIRFCNWHFFRSLASKAKSKIGDETTRTSAIAEFHSLFRTKTIQEFIEMWEKYKQTYHNEDDWLRYLLGQWMAVPEGGGSAIVLTVKRHNQKFSGILA